MIDKNAIPYFGVLLTKKDTTIYPHFTLPEGYSICMYESGMETEWVKLNIIYETFDSFGQAFSYFSSAFSEDRHILQKQLVFVKEDKTNDIVATALLWEGMHFGKPAQRIHFLAVHPFHRNKGIGKAMMTKLLDIYNEQGYNQGIYITSQTWDYMQINLYFSFGFLPYKGEKPARWNSTVLQFDTNKSIAWDIVLENIGKRLFKENPEPEQPFTNNDGE